MNKTKEELGQRGKDGGNEWTSSGMKLCSTYEMIIFCTSSSSSLKVSSSHCSFPLVSLPLRFRTGFDIDAAQRSYARFSVVLQQ